MATLSEITSVLYSGDPRANSLLHPFTNWNYLTGDVLVAVDTLAFSFALDADVSRAAPDHSPLAFNSVQQAAVRALLAYSEGVTGIHFVEVADAARAQLHFANSDLDGNSVSGLTVSSYAYSGSAERISSFSAEAFVFLDDVQWAAFNTAPRAGTEGYETLLHELGHALGLGHPFDGTVRLPASEDNTNNTVMSYTRAGGPKSLFQPYDLLALQWIYGGDGLGGTLGYNSTLGPSLSGGSGITIIGSAAGDSLVGGPGGDTIRGLAGNDFLVGQGGDDVLDGGPGIDTAIYSNSRDAYVLTHGVASMPCVI